VPLPLISQMFVPETALDRHRATTVEERRFRDGEGNRTASARCLKLRPKIQRLVYINLRVTLFRIDMHTIVPVSASIPKSESYQQVYNQLAELIKGEPDFLANAANTAALLYHLLPDVNWVGFYFFRENELVLGPFQGRPACSRIGIGKGVCGKAAADRETLIVGDVTRFKGHIVCDPSSQAEIVVPLLNWGKLIGVLDVDSAKQDRFDDDDREGLESLMSLLLAAQTTDDDVPDFEGLADGAEE